MREILSEFVPACLIERPKSGFAIPIGSWMRNELRDWCEELLEPIFTGDDDNLNGLFIKKIWTEHLTGARNWQHKLWAILMYQCWKSIANDVSHQADNSNTAINYICRGATCTVYLF